MEAPVPTRYLSFHLQDSKKLYLELLTTPKSIELLTKFMKKFQLKLLDKYNVMLDYSKTSFDDVIGEESVNV